MALAKSDRIHLRCSPFEKEEWGKAAGGSGKISEWARAVLNAEAARVNAVPGSARTEIEALLETGSAELVEELAADIAQHKLDAAKTPLKTDVVQGYPARKPEPSEPTKCSRWMHHRKGVYCGSCGKVN